MAIGVTQTGLKLVLGFQVSDKESAPTWREFFKDLKKRGLDGSKMEERISLRTTNIIERLNKEFKRRTEPMEIVAGENACYTLLAFICLKMELYWKSNPIGKVRKNLPFFKELVESNSTKNLTIPDIRFTEQGPKEVSRFEICVRNSAMELGEKSER